MTDQKRQAEVEQTWRALIDGYGYVSWRAKAACRGMDPGLFFDEERPEEAKATCATCPVRHQCLWDAIETGDDGVRGGYTYAERVVMLADSAPPMCTRCGRYPAKQTGHCDGCERERAAEAAWVAGSADPESDGRRRYRSRRNGGGAGKRAGDAVALQADPAGWKPGLGISDEDGGR